MNVVVCVWDRLELSTLPSDKSEPCWLRLFAVQTLVPAFPVCHNKGDNSGRTDIRLSQPS